MKNRTLAVSAFILIALVVFGLNSTKKGITSEEPASTVKLVNLHVVDATTGEEVSVGVRGTFGNHSLFIQNGDVRIIWKDEQENERDIEILANGYHPEVIPTESIIIVDGGRLYGLTDGGFDIKPHKLELTKVEQVD